MSGRRQSILVTLAMLSIEIGPVEILSILLPRTSTLEGAESAVALAVEYAYILEQNRGLRCWRTGFCLNSVGEARCRQQRRERRDLYARPHGTLSKTSPRSRLLG